MGHDSPDTQHSTQPPSAGRAVAQLKRGSAEMRDATAACAKVGKNLARTSSSMMDAAAVVARNIRALATAIGRLKTFDLHDKVSGLVESACPVHGATTLATVHVRKSQE